MKRNDITALHDQTIEELQQKLAELRIQLAKAKLELPVGKLSDVRLPSKLRDDIARVKTIMRKKQLSNLDKTQVVAKEVEKSADKETK